MSESDKRWIEGRGGHRLGLDAERINELAARVARRLFTDGRGEHADRLQMRFGVPVEADRPGGGWCERAAADLIAKVLTEELDPARVETIQAVREWPGCTATELGRRIGVRGGTLVTRLKKFEQQGLVRSQREKGRFRWYLADNK